MPVVTGVNRLHSEDLDVIMPQINELVEQMRFVHLLEKLVVVSIGMVLYDAGIPIPVGNADVGLYAGIDDSIEDIKNEYFNNILSEGLLGVSPQIFQFTTPNALAAQATIAFDIRGECLTLPIKVSFKDVIDYAAECMDSNYTKMAIAGGVMRDKSPSSHSHTPAYRAEFFFLEMGENAMERGARVYHNILEGNL